MSVALTALLLTVGALTGPNPQEPGAGGAVRCEIQVIHATRGEPSMDPSLKPLARYLQNSFGSRFQVFTLLERSSMRLAPDQRVSKKLPNATDLTLSFLGSDRGRLRLALEVGGLKTIVKVHDGGLFFQAGRRYKGGMLIVAIRARSL